MRQKTKFKKDFFLVFFVLLILSVRSQNTATSTTNTATNTQDYGLDNVIVEKYYIANANDTAAGMYNGFLAFGSTTYRIFVDMKPGYRFQAAYGSPEHELRIETSTYFFNNTDIGNKTPNVIPRRTLGRNTVMLDSWLSVGAAGEGCLGILKAQDDSLGTIPHDGLFLQNKDKTAGFPVIHRDGLIRSDRTPVPTFYAIDSISDVFFNGNRKLFSTKNGAWVCYAGSVGPDSLTTNRVLIAQLTTDGDLKFELNIQIGKPGSPAENYVARDPIEKEMMVPYLIYDSSRQQKPVTTITKKPVKKNK
jgi:hypothetical protein